jgi:uncharacterized protein (PEP-CTERM system associated)
LGAKAADDFAVNPPENVRGFQPRIDAAEIYVDNVDLAPPGDPKESAFITELRPGFKYAEDRPRFQTQIDYTFQYLLYSNSSGRDQSYHTLAAYANGEVLPDLFYIRADAGAAQVVLNPTQPSTLDTVVNGTGNLINGYTGSISPYLQKHVGDTVALVEYTRGFVTYRGTENGGFETATGANITGSQNSRVRASWGTDEKSLTRFSWNVSYDHQVADYGDEAPTFRYSEALLTLGYGVTRQLRLIAEGGSETNPAKSNGNNNGDLNTGFYQGGFEYTLGRSNQIHVLVGHRFYGTSYDFLYRYTGRVLELESTYTEGPTTEAQELFIRPINGAAGAPPVVQPVLAGGDLAALTGEVFVRKYFDNRLRLRGRRTAIELDVNVYQRNYVIDKTKDDRTVLADAGIIRDLNSRDRVRLVYGFRRYYLVNGQDLRESAFRLQWLRQISRSLNLTGTLGRLEGTGSTQHYNVNFAMLGISKNFF